MSIFGRPAGIGLDYTQLKEYWQSAVSRVQQWQD